MKFHLSSSVPKLQYELLPLLRRMFHLLYVIVHHSWQVCLWEFTLLEDLEQASLSYCSVSYDDQLLHLKISHFSAKKTCQKIWEELKVLQSISFCICQDTVSICCEPLFAVHISHHITGGPIQRSQIYKVLARYVKL